MCQALCWILSETQKCQAPSLLSSIFPSISEKIFLSHIVQLPTSQGKNSFYSGMIILYSLLLNGLSDRALASSFQYFLFQWLYLECFSVENSNSSPFPSPFCLSSGATSMCPPLLIQNSKILKGIFFFSLNLFFRQNLHHSFIQKNVY